MKLLDVLTVAICVLVLIALVAGFILQSRDCSEAGGELLRTPIGFKCFVMPKGGAA